jgi:hypothetical protein
MDDAQVKISNASFLSKVSSDNPALVKEAADGVNDYTRVKMREEGFLRKILPPITITSDQIDRSVETDKPVKIVDMEPDSPAAMMVPFATNPSNRYLKAPRYRVAFARIQTRQYAKDVDELHTYHMDLRQIISDNAIKDMLAEEDSKWIKAITNVLVAPEATVPETGAVQWKTLVGGITRDNLAESLKIQPRTFARLESKTGLINHISVKDLLKFTRDVAGGDVSQDMFLNGFSEQKIMGVNWIVTIKQDLVPEDTIFYFTEPQALGKFYILEDATMFLEKRAWMIQFFAYECIGASIGNVAGVVRVDFNGEVGSD